jgi:NAD(P)-dependent dehydrogenase (short-subunit alcohol dehydrogenase family)
MQLDVKSQFDLTGKVAIVTGASKGIGEAIALGLAQCGAKVVVSSRKQEAVDETAAAFRSQGLEATGIACHMGSAGAIGELVEKTLAKYGGVDILINNAATNPVFGPLVEQDERSFDQIVSVNIKGPLELARKAHASMVSRGGGSIVNISSVGGVRPERGLAIYSMSKAALISLTKSMAQEWGPAGIRANAILPGLIQTKFSTALWQNEKLMKQFLAMIALGRIGQPEELAGLAVFLAAPASQYCTGAIFTADGGLTI